MKPTEAAWLAGIIDGEGCITITRQKPGSGGRKNWSYRLYLKVTMGDEATIRRILAIAGCGTVTVQKPKPGKGWNIAFTWWASSREALSILARTRPHLVTKSQEADIAAEWGRLPLAPRGGRSGGKPVPPELLKARHNLFLRLRKAKPKSEASRTNAKRRRLNFARQYKDSHAT